jgi:hypothetical protein
LAAPKSDRLLRTAAAKTLPESGHPRHHGAAGIEWPKAHRTAARQLKKALLSAALAARKAA